MGTGYYLTQPRKDSPLGYKYAYKCQERREEMNYIEEIMNLQRQAQLSQSCYPPHQSPEEPKTPTEKRRINMLDSVKSYFVKHQETILTLGIVVLVDNYFFNGALRERIKGLLEKALSGVEKKVEEIHGTK